MSVSPPIHPSAWKVDSQKLKSMIQRDVLEGITGRRRNRLYAAIQIVKVLQGPLRAISVTRFGDDLNYILAGTYTSMWGWRERPAPAP
jgi:hypothetical protein